MPKTFNVCISTMDAELEFPLEQSAKGSELFDLVVRTLGVRETWYFGLQFEYPTGELAWLQFDKKVYKQNKTLKEPFALRLRAKFYPEDVAEELVQEITQHLFYLQVKDAILTMKTFCPPEASVLLASYAVQAKFGDYDKDLHKPGFLQNEHLLPQTVIEQYQMTPAMWEERITSWYAEHHGLTRDEAEMEYLKLAQDLEMYGVSYFDITNKKGTAISLGIDCRGLNIYEKDNRLNPKTSFPWKEIKNISFHSRTFVIKSIDKQAPDFIFKTGNPRTNKVILELCLGNHELFKRRRKPDTMEIQQMKALAKEEKMRRQIERNKLLVEQQAREEAIRQKEELQARLQELQNEADSCREALMRSEETAELLAEKARVAEEEATLLQRKATDAEEELRRLRLSASKSEEEKSILERRAREADELFRRVFQESEARGRENLLNAKHTEKKAVQKLAELSSSSNNLPSYNSIAQEKKPDANRSYLYDYKTEAENLRLVKDSEKERYDQYVGHRRSQQLQMHLKDLEDMRIRDRQSSWDGIHEDNQKRGETKYSTLQKITTGSSKARIEFFEEL
ncbi:predicted protein [Nematostella vectensis]|uniref:FERM domain-containing protein n=1 Tax=Nematostella vectensis TaxID=45351 RepID=A7RWH0_NEMVE|nr:merlin [Nematostella vectensis]EDO44119.1 predicted protein [Nematostella vectensis]|eukprot:XP_001636182.1 predicted protein [Nematostella vectensis]